jgi:hypothetical protein
MNGKQFQVKISGRSARQLPGAYRLQAGKLHRRDQPQKGNAA